MKTTLEKLFIFTGTLLGTSVMFHGSHANYPNVEKALAVVALLAAGFVGGCTHKSPTTK